MTLLTHQVVLHLVCRHLRLADAFRLRHALGRDADTLWLDDVPARYAAHMGLTGRYDMRTLGRKMATCRTRCIECGVVTARQPKVCEACASDPASSVAMLTRRQIRERQRSLAKPDRVRELERHALPRLPVAKVGRASRFWYWKRDVDAMFDQAARHRSQTTTR